VVTLLLVPYVAALGFLAAGFVVGAPLDLIGLLSFVLGLILFVLLGIRKYGRMFATQPSPLAFRVITAGGTLIGFLLLIGGRSDLLGVMLPVAFLPGYEFTALMGKGAWWGQH
jgi:hypothetical protein